MKFSSRLHIDYLLFYFLDIKSTHCDLCLIGGGGSVRGGEEKRRLRQRQEEGYKRTKTMGAQTQHRDKEIRTNKGKSAGNYNQKNKIDNRGHTDTRTEGELDVKAENGLPLWNFKQRQRVKCHFPQRNRPFFSSQSPTPVRVFAKAPMPCT